jgi:hypothetical protein
MVGNYFLSCTKCYCVVIVEQAGKLYSTTFLGQFCLGKKNVEIPLTTVFRLFFRIMASNHPTEEPWSRNNASLEDKYLNSFQFEIADRQVTIKQLNVFAAEDLVI